MCEYLECLFVGKPWLKLLADRVQLLLLLLLRYQNFAPKIFVQTFLRECLLCLLNRAQFFYFIAVIFKSFLKIGSESGKFRGRRDMRRLLHSKVAHNDFPPFFSSVGEYNTCRVPWQSRRQTLGGDFKCFWPI